jgi:hypothetical protein
LNRSTGRQPRTPWHRRMLRRRGVEAPWTAWNGDHNSIGHPPRGGSVAAGAGRLPRVLLHRGGP